jgi:hypothetical protein
VQPILIASLLIVLVTSCPGDAEQKCAADMAGYQRLKNGMSYEQAVRAIGCEGSEMSRAGSGTYESVTYAWYGSDGISNVTGVFMNNKLEGKAQFGMQ